MTLYGPHSPPRRPTGRFGLVWPWLALLTGASSPLACSKTTGPETGLMIIINTDMTPTEYDSIRVEVSQEQGAGSGQWHKWEGQDKSVPEEVTLPATVFVHSGQAADQDALIQVAAYLMGQPVVLREAQLQIPTDRVAELRLVLAESCKGQVRVVGAEGDPMSTCGVAGQSCQPATGMCGDSIVSAPLPPFNPPDVNPDAGDISSSSSGSSYVGSSGSGAASSGNSSGFVGSGSGRGGGSGVSGSDAGSSGGSMLGASSSGAGSSGGGDAGSSGSGRPNASSSGGSSTADGGREAGSSVGGKPDAGSTGASSSGSSSSGGRSSSGGSGSSGGMTSSGGSSSSGNSGTPDSGRGAGCGADNTACMDVGTEGLCKGGACAHCTDVTDNAHCTAAYGGATIPYLCLGAACTPGNCLQDADCAGNPNGPLCGVATPHVCGKCTTDQQCAAETAAPVCNTATGACVAGTCTAPPVGGGAPGACAINASDICCTGTCQPGAGINACCPGVNAAAYCETTINDAVCVNNACTRCPGVTGSTYLIDPVNGSDQAGTGDSTTPGCAFKTIGRAIAVVGSPVGPTTIAVLGPSMVSATTGELFPLVLPQNVTLTATGDAVVIDVSSGSQGFTLTNPGSAINGGTLGDAGIASLTIEPAAGSSMATLGIVVNNATGAGITPDTSPQIANVVVTGFPNDGILVQNVGMVRIGAGVTSTLNALAGLHVTASGQAIVDVASGDLPTHFDGNMTHGIYVTLSGAITVTGSVTDVATGTGTVTTNRNVEAGVWIEQTPGGTPMNSITGLVAFGNTGGDGLRFVGGSNVKLRGSAAVGNLQSGLIVSTGGLGIGGNDISMIDIGTAPGTGGSFGGNTFQEPLGGGSNGGVGICVNLADNAGLLQAKGNIFGAINCATTAGLLTLNLGACANGAVCAGGICDLGVLNNVGNTIDVSMCMP